MLSEYLASEEVQKALEVLKNQFPLAIWETVYVTLLSTLFAIVIGLPLGVLLVAGENKKILRIPQGVLHVINVIINLLRSVPFLILMIMVFPLTRLIVGTVVGTPATVVPLVIAAFPFVARLVESSLREINPSIIEAAQSLSAAPEVAELAVLIEGGGVPYHMIVNMGFVDVRTDDVGMIAFCKPPRQLTAQTVCFLRGDLARAEGLAKVVSNHIIRTPHPPGVSDVLLFR